MAKRPRPEFSPIVGEVVKDPAKPRESKLLTGYAGESSREGYVRLYVDLHFCNFVDVKVEDIFSSKTVTRPNGPLDIVYVWIAPDADLKWTIRQRLDRTPFLTEFGCAPNTTHQDGCPTTTFNTPGCGGTTDGPGCGGFTENLGCNNFTEGSGCPGFTEDCGQTEGCGFTEDCTSSSHRSRSRGRYRRIW
jgi:hypothetical protein